MNNWATRIKLDTTNYQFIKNLLPVPVHSRQAMKMVF